MNDPYEILGLASTATSSEIDKAYKRACMRFHPDRGGTNEDFIRISKAYKALKRRMNVCPVCFGKGFTVRREGFFVVRVPCPRCWK
jgi:DnaJ-class molecular chaperone